jgi:prophage DNA circulation protein
MGFLDGAVDSAIPKIQGMFDQNVRPMFDQLKAELAADRDTDAHLNESVQSLQHSIDALTQMQRAVLAQMRAVNAHPKVAARPPAK